MGTNEVLCNEVFYTIIMEKKVGSGKALGRSRSWSRYLKFGNNNILSDSLKT